MSNFLIYILELSLVFSILSLFYFFILRGLTFHRFNRIILILIIPISLIAPKIDLNKYASSQIKIYELKSGFNNLNNKISIELEQSKHIPNVIIYYIEIIYFLGVFTSIVLLLISLFKLSRIYYSSQRSISGHHVLYRAKINTPFSSFGRIFVPYEFDVHRHSIIVEHELEHIKSHHSLDLLIAELFLAFNWFNPISILYRNMIKTIHEFEVDDKLLKRFKKSEYLSELLNSVLRQNQLTLTNNFNNSNLKTRIAMITKTKNSNIHKIKYLLIIPLAFLMAFSFNDISGNEPSIFPLEEGTDKEISSPFGKSRKDPFGEEVKVHGGIDIPAKIGTRVLATGDGKIIKASEEGHWGNLVVIDHGQGFQTWYAHLNDIMVEKGQKINSRDLIGHVGNTGKSTNPHLHYEVRKNDERVNPEDFFQK